MKLESKFRLPLVMLSTFVILACTWLWFRAHKDSAPQIITLPDGTKCEFAGVTYSKRCVPPTLAAQFASWLPLRLANWFEKYSHAQISQWNRGEKFDTPHLFIWLRLLGTNSTSTTYGLRLADQTGTEGGVRSFATLGGGIPWGFAEFPVFPKRSRLIACHFYNFNYTPGPTTPIATLAIPNPAYGQFPTWAAEPIPVSKRVGDLEVRLWEFMTGFSGTVSYGGRSDGTYGPIYVPVMNGQDAGTWFGLTAKSTTGTNESWVVHRSELSDATGNVLSGSAEYFNYPQWRAPLRETVREPISGTLWRDESAWRLKLQLKRAIGFDSTAVITFTNVPVPPIGTTNAMPITRTGGGIKVVLTEFANNSPPTAFTWGNMMSPANRIRVELPGKPEGVALDFLSITTDAGKPETSAWSGGNGDFVQYFKYIPTNAHTATISFLDAKNPHGRIPGQAARPVVT